MPPAGQALSGFLRLCGTRVFEKRLTELGRRTQSGALQGRAAQQRHALEFALARVADPRTPNRASLAERRIGDFARGVTALATSLPPIARRRLKDQVEAALQGEATLVPLFHLVRTAALHKARGFTVRFCGLLDEAPFDLTIARDGVEAEIACETISAEEGRPLHKGDWYALVDRINPELQTWLAAHPGRYLLKMTLPEGVSSGQQLAELHRRISDLLQAEKRQDHSAGAVLKLDPLVLAGAQAAPGLSAQLRAQFGREAHLAVTTSAEGRGVFVMAARAGREDEISAAVCRRMAMAAPTRLSGRKPGILAMFLDDLDRAEWRALRSTLELEGAARRFLTDPAARPLVAITCASRMELYGLAEPDSAPGGELRFRNPLHPAAKNAALAAAVTSSV
ncbi:hypothetical protein [Plastoroseomonas arctica]